MLLALVLDGDHDQVCLVYEVGGREEHSSGLALLEILLQRIGKPLGVLDKLAFSLLKSLFPLSTRNVG